MKEKTVFVLRWLAVLPAFAVAGALVKWLGHLVAYRLIDGSAVHVIEDGPDWAGHYIFGPIYLFFLCATTTSCSIMAACLVAPQGRWVLRIVLATLIGALILFLAYLVSANEEFHHTGAQIARQVVLMAGVLIGVWTTFTYELRGDKMSLRDVIDSNA